MCHFSRIVVAVVVFYVFITASQWKNQLRQMLDIFQAVFPVADGSSEAKGRRKTHAVATDFNRKSWICVMVGGCCCCSSIVIIIVFIVIVVVLLVVIHVVAVLANWFVLQQQRAIIAGDYFARSNQQPTAVFLAIFTVNCVRKVCWRMCMCVSFWPFPNGRCSCSKQPLPSITRNAFVHCLIPSFRQLSGNCCNNRHH